MCLSKKKKKKERKKKRKEKKKERKEEKRRDIFVQRFCSLKIFLIAEISWDFLNLIFVNLLSIHLIAGKIERLYRPTSKNNSYVPLRYWSPQHCEVSVQLKIAVVVITWPLHEKVEFGAVSRYVLFQSSGSSFPYGDLKVFLWKESDRFLASLFPLFFYW